MAGTGRRLCLLLVSAFALATMPQAAEVARLPAHMAMTIGAASALPAGSVLTATLDGGPAASLTGGKDGTARVTALSQGEARVSWRLMGLWPVKTVNLKVEARRMLVPGGQSVGVAIDTRGVIMVGASDLGGTASPARLAGLESGDIIRRANGRNVDDAEALSRAVHGETPVRLEVERDGEVVECLVKPALDPRDGSWRLGAWVRDSTAGIGTLSWVDPEDGIYGALGHAITDVDTGVTMPVGEGAIYANRVVDVTRSQSGAPGEMTGDFVFNPTLVGTVLGNTSQGIFGVADGGLYGASRAVPVAQMVEIHPGPATLLTTVDGEGVREYTCEIVRINPHAEAANRAMVIRITDDALLERTGGIVQGMSGSPILQDGRLAGAVTHVMVNEPAMGYAIGIEAMLEDAEGIKTDQSTKAKSVA